MGILGKILIILSIIIVILLVVGDVMVYKATNQKQTYSKLDSLDRIDTALKIQMSQIKTKTKDKKDSVSISSYTRYNQLNTKMISVRHQIDSIKNKLN